MTAEVGPYIRQGYLLRGKDELLDLAYEQTALEQEVSGVVAAWKRLCRLALQGDGQVGRRAPKRALFAELGWRNSSSGEDPALGKNEGRRGRQIFVCE